MQSFHNDNALKAEYIARLEHHHRADEIIQGLYWENGKGCAVGCTLHSSNHNAYETKLGIPVQLAHLEDRIFEYLPVSAAKDFPLEFLTSIPVGVDLNPVWQNIMVWLMIDKEWGVLQYAKTEEQKKVIQNVADLYARWINGKKPPQIEWKNARKQAKKAGEAESAAWEPLAALAAWVAAEWEPLAALAAVAEAVAAAAVAVAAVAVAEADEEGAEAWEADEEFWLALKKYLITELQNAK